MRRPALTVSLHVAGHRAVVVGDGALADERAARLRDAGAPPERIAAADWRAERAAGARLVLACTGDPALDWRIAADASAAGALAYAHDQPDVSDFGFPALARRGPLAIAITSDNVAPALARQLRLELERLLAESGAVLDALLDELEERRAAVPPGPERTAELRRLAARLHLAGRLAVDGD
ncbi:MAG TPA: NAD(P)-dependent oxidoreductase [Kofleriaceae bacterium]|jgi:siroheme synthase (precorrin-2 oxidase/ferrochelatase)|nr:NAD(P)-dependent oxidoreductase [Kofleriaceae bacterium]